MPIVMKALFLIFLFIPVVSAVTSLHEHLGITRNIGLSVFFVLTYWCLPSGLCFCLLSKRRLFLPGYFLQCACLAVYAAILGSGQSFALMIPQYLLIGLMAYVGLLMSDKNFLYPFLSREFRHWRMSVRYQTNLRVLVSVGKNKMPIPAIAMDCSRTGMKLRFLKRDIQKLDSQLESGRRIEAIMGPMNQVLGKNISEIPLEIIWNKSSETDLVLGAKSLELKKMESFVNTEVIPNGAKQTSSNGIGPLERDMEQTALVFWVICIALSFALPAFNTIL